jgi:hypothetical protein
LGRPDENGELEELALRIRARGLVLDQVQFSRVSGTASATAGTALLIHNGYSQHVSGDRPRGRQDRADDQFALRQPQHLCVALFQLPDPDRRHRRQQQPAVKPELWCRCTTGAAFADRRRQLALKGGSDVSCRVLFIGCGDRDDRRPQRQKLVRLVGLRRCAVHRRVAARVAGARSEAPALPLMRRAGAPRGGALPALPKRDPAIANPPASTANISPGAHDHRTGGGKVAVNDQSALRQPPESSTCPSSKSFSFVAQRRVAGRISRPGVGAKGCRCGPDPRGDACG